MRPQRDRHRVKAAVHVTVKMARCKVRATVMAVSPPVVAQSQSNARAEPRDWRLTWAGTKPPEHPRALNGANSRHRLLSYCFDKTLNDHPTRVKLTRPEMIYQHI